MSVFNRCKFLPEHCLRVQNAGPNCCFRLITVLLIDHLPPPSFVPRLSLNSRVWRVTRQTLLGRGTVERSRRRFSFCEGERPNTPSLVLGNHLSCLPSSVSSLRISGNSSTNSATKPEPSIGRIPKSSLSTSPESLSLSSLEKSSRPTSSPAPTAEADFVVNCYSSVNRHPGPPTPE